MALHPSTLAFLRDLKLNNNREWFNENRSRYEVAKADFIELGTRIVGLINEFDPSLGAVDPRKAMFRINRDTRFSANKAPYKPNMGMALTPMGAARTTLSCYYIHIEAGSCMLATGVYMPQPPVLKAIRKFIDDEQHEFMEFINNPTFRATFNDLNREGKVLKRVPNGFDPQSAVAEYLKLADFHVARSFCDNQVCSDGFAQAAADIFKVSMPLNAFLNKAITDME